MTCSTGLPTIPAAGRRTTCGGPSAPGTTAWASPPYIVEQMLNHILDGVMAVYNHATYDAERRQALEAWSACSRRSLRSSAPMLSLRHPQAAA